MLLLKKFLRYDNYGKETVAVFESGLIEFIEVLENGPEVDGLPRTLIVVPDGVDANQAVSQSDLEKWITTAKQTGSDTSAYERVLSEWPVSPSTPRTPG